MTTTYLSNAFSPNMLVSMPMDVRYSEITAATAAEYVRMGAQSAVGHKSTADVFAAELGVEIPMNRATLLLKAGDVFHNDWVSRFDPVRTDYVISWSSPSGEPRPLVYRENLDTEKPASAYMNPAVFVNEDARLEVVLRLMQRAGQRTAIVLSPELKEIGVVKLKDILKVMFGEMKL